jgi:hypothetical protein
MNTTSKIVLGIVIGLVVLCAAAATAGLLLFRTAGKALIQTVNTDPVVAMDLSNGIADYDLPAGFGKPYATNLAGFTLIAYNGDDQHSHIYFFQMPSNIQISQAELESKLREAAPNSSRPDQVKLVGHQTATIRGQQVELALSEGINHDGQAYREITGMFKGNGGQALVLYSSPVTSWDQAKVDQFLSSIR